MPDGDSVLSVFPELVDKRDHRMEETIIPPLLHKLYRKELLSKPI